MKKKIFIALGLVCIIFISGGVYMVTTIQNASSELGYLIKLHQVEILREHFLIQIKNVQSDLYLIGTRYDKSPDEIMANVDKLKRVSVACFDCHHTPQVVKRLEGLNSGVELFRGSINRILTLKANRVKWMQDGDRAYQTSQKLVEQVNDMVHMASNKLGDKTAASLDEIGRSKHIVNTLVVITLLVAAGFCFFVIGEFTKPVKVLLKATRQLQEGDLDYRIEGLKNEFGEVATSFNAMSESLKQNILNIRENERRYRTLFESAGDAIFIIEAEGDNLGDIVDANQAAADMHGYDIDELLKLNLIKDLDAPEDAAVAPERAQRILEGEWIKAELNHRTKDDTIFPVEISAGLIEYMGNRYILAIDRDISVRREMEQMVLQAKQEWEDTFNTITDMITIHDKNFRIIRANKAAEKILGLPFLDDTEAKCYQYFHGKESPPENCPSCQCYHTQKPASFEMHEPHLNKFLEIRAMPRFDSENQLIGLIHVIRDITDRKRVEEALQRTEQLKMVGEWAAGLAHEIKNPLAGIKGSVEVLLQEPSISEEDRSIVVKAVDEIKRIELLIKSLLNFAKPPQLQLMSTDINDLLDKTIAFSLKHPLLSSNSASPIKVLRDFDSRLPITMADPMQLQQVFLNLMFNAIEAMPDGGALKVRTSYDPALNSIRIAIADNGKGIEQMTLEQIFQPFFTTKSKGSGLGLAITRRLVEEHGGDIYVESTPNKGTVVNVSLQVFQEIKEQIA
ncbi:MAG: PAS domain S-box protein [Desulfobacterales bacterium]|nr:MAG: PAS domain S-box protein [Desulfobacterales bacterium]